MDLTEDNSIVKCVETVITKEGKIDILINNAGFGQFGALEDVSMIDARKQMEVNVFGLARIAQLVIPHMRSNKSGKIVNISSVAGKITTSFGGWYQASKYAVESLSDSMRLDLKPFGIDVIIIEPGGVKSEWSSIMLEKFVASTSLPYKPYAEKVAKGTRATYASKAMPGPEVVSKTIFKAITDRKPKTRYVCGHMGKSALLMRRLLSDKMFDVVASNISN